jgi:hypothetical protein
MFAACLEGLKECCNCCAQGAGERQPLRGRKNIQGGEAPEASEALLGVRVENEQKVGAAIPNYRQDPSGHLLGSYAVYTGDNDNFRAALAHVRTNQRSCRARNCCRKQVRELADSVADLSDKLDVITSTFSEEGVAQRAYKDAYTLYAAVEQMEDDTERKHAYRTIVAVLDKLTTSALQMGYGGAHGYKDDNSPLTYAYNLLFRLRGQHHNVLGHHHPLSAGDIIKQLRSVGGVDSRAAVLRNERRVKGGKNASLITALLFAFGLLVLFYLLMRWVTVEPTVRDIESLPYHPYSVMDFFWNTEAKNRAGIGPTDYAVRADNRNGVYGAFGGVSAAGLVVYQAKKKYDQYYAEKVEREGFTIIEKIAILLEFMSYYRPNLAPEVPRLPDFSPLPPLDGGQPPAQPPRNPPPGGGRHVFPPGGDSGYWQDHRSAAPHGMVGMDDAAALQAARAGLSGAHRGIGSSSISSSSSASSAQQGIRQRNTPPAAQLLPGQSGSAGPSGVLSGGALDVIVHNKKE